MEGLSGCIGGGRGVGRVWGARRGSDWGVDDGEREGVGGGDILQRW